MNNGNDDDGQGERGMRYWTLVFSMRGRVDEESFFYKCPAPT